MVSGGRVIIMSLEYIRPSVVVLCFLPDDGPEVEYVTSEDKLKVSYYSMYYCPFLLSFFDITNIFTCQANMISINLVQRFLFHILEPVWSNL